MNKIIMVMAGVLLLSCNKPETCRPYSDAVKDGSAPFKTTTLHLSDSLKYELEYVRDQKYRNKPYFCYGHLELEKHSFIEATKSFTKGFNPERILKVDLFGGGKNICFDESIVSGDITSCLVYYLDNENYASMAYINLKTGLREKHRISNGYASVSIYFLFNKSKITNKPSIITIENKDKSFRDKGVKFILKREDAVYKEAALSYQE